MFETAVRPLRDLPEGVPRHLPARSALGDAIAVKERPDLTGFSDQELLRSADGGGSCVVDGADEGFH